MNHQAAMPKSDGVAAMAIAPLGDLSFVGLKFCLDCFDGSEHGDRRELKCGQSWTNSSENIDPDQDHAAR